MQQLVLSRPATYMEFIFMTDWLRWGYLRGLPLAAWIGSTHISLIPIGVTEGYIVLQRETHD